MRKFLFILSILLMWPTMVNAETSQNEQPYHPLGCIFEGTCAEGNFTDLNSRKEGDGITYVSPKRSYVRVEGQTYTVLEYNNDRQVIKKGWH